jgi:hypothetical protein
VAVVPATSSTKEKLTSPLDPPLLDGTAALAKVPSTNPEPNSVKSMLSPLDLPSPPTIASAIDSATAPAATAAAVAFAATAAAVAAAAFQSTPPPLPIPQLPSVLPVPPLS